MSSANMTTRCGSNARQLAGSPTTSCVHACVCSSSHSRSKTRARHNSKKHVNNHSRPSSNVIILALPASKLVTMISERISAACESGPFGELRGCGVGPIRPFSTTSLGRRVTMCRGSGHGLQSSAAFTRRAGVKKKACCADLVAYTYTHTFSPSLYYISHYRT